MSPMRFVFLVNVTAKPIGIVAKNLLNLRSATTRGLDCAKNLLNLRRNTPSVRGENIRQSMVKISVAMKVSFVPQ